MNSSRAAVGTESSQRRVLLVGDAGPITNASQRLLEAAGHRVVVVGDPDQARAAARQQADVLLVVGDSLEGWRALLVELGQRFPQAPRCIVLLAGDEAARRGRVPGAEVHILTDSIAWQDALAAAVVDSTQLSARHLGGLDAAGASPVDLTGLRTTFAELGVEESELRAIVRTFLDEFAPGLEALRAAVDDEDAVAVVHAAHGLKSPSATLGAFGLAALLRTLEQRGRDEDLADARHLVELAALEFERVRDALRRQFQGV